MRIGLIGRGRWGGHLQRATQDVGHEVVWYDPEQRGGMPSVEALLLRTERVIIATPPHLHAQMVDAAIDHRVPFLVEKPLAMNVDDAERLLTRARASGVQGAVNHIALFADGLQPFRSTRPRLTEALRTSSNAGYHNIPAWWDIGVHDVAVCVDMYGRPDTVSLVQDFDNYRATLAWPGATAIIQGTRTAHNKRWEIWFGDHGWDAYGDPGREPLKNLIGWWCAGGDNLDHAVTVVETLERGECG